MGLVTRSIILRDLPNPLSPALAEPRDRRLSAAPADTGVRGGLFATGPSPSDNLAPRRERLVIARGVRLLLVHEAKGQTGGEDEGGGGGAGRGGGDIPREPSYL